MEARAAILQSVEKAGAVSSMRGMVEAWAVFRGRWRATAEQRRKKGTEKGDFSPVEGFDSLHWVITPQKGLKPSEGQ